MTVASADRQYQRKEGKLVNYKMIAADIVYKGTMVTTPVGEATNAGYAKPATNELFSQFLGVCVEKIDNSSGAIGVKSVRVWTSGSFEFVFSGTATQADVGKTVYIVDDQTVAFEGLTTAFMVEAGVIVEYISATLVRVEIGDAVNKFPETFSYPMATTANITRGDIVCQSDAEYVNVGADSSYYFFVGIAIESVNNTGADGALSILVAKDCMVYHASTQAAATYQIGDPVYVDGAATYDTAAGTAKVDMLYGRLHRKPAAGNYGYVHVQQLIT